jgi:hypothetical protein
MKNIYFKKKINLLISRRDIIPQMGNDESRIQIKIQIIHLIYLI